jgi:hypothetical protein
LLANIGHASPQISDEGQAKPIKTLKDWNLSPISRKKKEQIITHLLMGAMRPRVSKKMIFDL